MCVFDCSVVSASVDGAALTPDINGQRSNMIYTAKIAAIMEFCTGLCGAVEHRYMNQLDKTFSGNGAGGRSAPAP